MRGTLSWNGIVVRSLGGAVSLIAGRKNTARLCRARRVVRTVTDSAASNPVRKVVPSMVTCVL